MLQDISNVWIARKWHLNIDLCTCLSSLSHCLLNVMSQQSDFDVSTICWLMDHESGKQCNWSLRYASDKKHCNATFLCHMEHFCPSLVFPTYSFCDCLHCNHNWMSYRVSSSGLLAYLMLKQYVLSEYGM